MYSRNSKVVIPTLKHLFKNRFFSNTIAHQSSHGGMLNEHKFSDLPNQLIPRNLTLPAMLNKEAVVYQYKLENLCGDPSVIVLQNNATIDNLAVLKEIEKLGYKIIVITTTPTEKMQPMKISDNDSQFVMLSDANYNLTNNLKLPAQLKNGRLSLKPAILLVDNGGMITDVFPEEKGNAENVLELLSRQRHSHLNQF